MVLNLEEVLPGLKHTCLVDHSFWQSSSASSQVANILSEYKQVAEMVCNMARFVFLEQEKFSHLPKVDVNAQELRQWSTVLPQRLPKWAHEDVVAGVDSHLLSVCKQKEKSLYSAGLAAVAIIAKQCGDGVLPAMPPETQAQLSPLTGGCFSGGQQKHIPWVVVFSYLLPPL